MLSRHKHVLAKALLNRVIMALCQMAALRFHAQLNVLRCFLITSVQATEIGSFRTTSGRHMRKTHRDTHKLIARFEARQGILRLAQLHPRLDARQDVMPYTGAPEDPRSS